MSFTRVDGTVIIVGTMMPMEAIRRVRGRVSDYAI
jgi:hypothetical protein